MANRRLYELTAENSPAMTDLIPTEDPAGATELRKLTYTQLKTLLLGQSTGSFVTGNLSTYILTVVHGLGTSTPKVWVFNQNGVIQYGLTITSTDTNTVTIDCGAAITGTWTYLMER